VIEDHLTEGAGCAVSDFLERKGRSSTRRTRPRTPWIQLQFRARPTRDHRADALFTLFRAADAPGRGAPIHQTRATRRARKAPRCTNRGCVRRGARSGRWLQRTG